MLSQRTHARLQRGSTKSISLRRRDGNVRYPLRHLAPPTRATRGEQGIPQGAAVPTLRGGGRKSREGGRGRGTLPHTDTDPIGGTRGIAGVGVVENAPGIQKTTRKGGVVLELHPLISESPPPGHTGREVGPGRQRGTRGRTSIPATGSVTMATSHSSGHLSMAIVTTFPGTPAVGRRGERERENSVSLPPCRGSPVGPVNLPAASRDWR